MKQGMSWLILFFIGVVLVVMGLEGSLGKMLACIFIPSQVVIN